MTAFARRLSYPLLLALIAIAAHADDTVSQATRLGQIDFRNSGSAEAQASFLEGVLLLHSFEYDDAREAFQKAQRIDAEFAMAYWGEAMTFNHPLWGRQNLSAARRALRDLGPSLEARLATAPTEREKAYLRALDILFGNGAKEKRDRDYAEAMQQLSHDYPEDPDAAAFYALSLLGTSYGDRDVPTYMRAAAIAEEVFAKNPRHPGAAHYLIHSYDDPVHAPLGLRAARVYADIAPAAAHALHMPSHIFVAMGMWDDVVSSNEDSWAAAEARVKRKDLPVDERGFHMLHWLAYGYLQQGRYADAERLLQIIEQDAEKSGSPFTRGYLARVRSTHLIETRQWTHDAAGLSVDTSDLPLPVAASERFATGLAALMAGDGDTAEKHLAAMRARHTPSALDETTKGSPEAQAAGAMLYELEAMIRMRQGHPEQALSLMEKATKIEDAMSYTYGPPVPVKPSHELLGEMLLDLGRPAEALAEFELALARAPKRALSLLGRLRAAADAGNKSIARSAYRELQEVWRHASPSPPELKRLAAMLE